MHLDGKIVLLTGGAQGLGFAFSEILLEHGAKVSFCDINNDTGQDALKTLQTKYGADKVIFYNCDVTKQDEMEEFFRVTKEKFHTLDIVINNAGIGGETEWQKTIDVNLNGMIIGTRLALGYLRTDKGGNGGVIVNVSSAAGLRVNPFSPAYCASKFGILAYSKCLASNKDICSNGVRVNVLCPAFADTPLVAKVLESDDKDAIDFVNKIGIMTTREVAEGIYELIVDDAKNGAILKMSKMTGKEYVSLECQTV